MKKLIKTLFAVFALLPFVVNTALAAPAQKTASKQTQTEKSAKKAEKKSTAKKVADKKVAKKIAETKKASTKKSASKSDKKTAQKQPVNTKQSSKSQPQKNAKKDVKKGDKKVVKSVEKTKNTQPKTKAAEKNTAKAENAKQVGKTENAAKTENSATKTAPLSQAKKLVVVPKCQDRQVFNVLSDAFKQQGKATGAQMMVKQISQARETQHYPEQGIRSCHALVETNGKKYQTDYSVILNGSGFFVQVENAQVMF